MIRGSKIGSYEIEEWSGSDLQFPFKTSEDVTAFLEQICEEDGLDIARVAFVNLNRL